MHDFESSFKVDAKARRPVIAEPLHEDSREVCSEINYCLSYFGTRQQNFIDRSTRTVLKFIVGDLVNFYLNEDDDGSVDVIYTGPGLVKDLSLEEALAITIMVVNTAVDAVDSHS